MSKLKFLILQRYENKEEQESLMKKLGPFYTFKLHGYYRSLESLPDFHLSDDEIKRLIEKDTIEFDDVDQALFMYTRLKHRLTEEYSNRLGIVEIRLSTKNDETGARSDTYMDSFPTRSASVVDPSLESKMETKKDSSE